MIGVIGFATGLTLLGEIATAFALVAAFLNAAFGICLGCQLYPLVARCEPHPSDNPLIGKQRKEIHGSLRRPGHS